MGDFVSMGGFRFMQVTEEKDLRDIYKLRYKSYCEEWGFERPEDHPEGLEYDEYDKHSVHFICKKDSGHLIGTIRLILNSEKGFPIERHCSIDEDLSFMDRDRLAEISRLAISKEYLRRAEDRFMYNGTEEYHPEVIKITTERRKRYEIVCGLYKCIYRNSNKRGITHWYAVMGKGLYILLKRLRITFSPVGPEVDYHGLRTPYLGCIEDIEREVSTYNPELYKNFIDNSGPQFL
jgi:N-acyl amino acid synthase of PEP-CTERM/exosortase system